MDTNGYRIMGVILIIISAISLLVGNLIEELWSVTQKIFESSIIIFIGLLGIIFLGVSKKKKINKIYVWKSTGVNHPLSMNIMPVNWGSNPFPGTLPPFFHLLVVKSF